MKYLFIVHSHTVFLTSIGVINYLKICDEDIRFIYVRKYQNSIYKKPSKMIDLSNEYDLCNASLIHYWRFRKVWKSVDINIESFIGEKYIAFIPHPRNYLYQLFISNKKCEGINYIQEGAFAPNKLFKKKMGLKSFIYLVSNFFLFPFYKHRIWVSTHWLLPSFITKNKKIECYAISPNIFNKLDCNMHIIEWPNLKIDGEKNLEYPFFVFDSSIEHGIVEKKVYMEATKKLIQEKAESVNYIKFHPAQQHENMCLIKSFFTCANKVSIELPADIPCEAYLSTYENMKIYGFNSSLLIFAKQLHHNIFSFESELLKNSKKYIPMEKHL
jgi:hypothetical protein